MFVHVGVHDKNLASQNTQSPQQLRIRFLAEEILRKKASASTCFKPLSLASYQVGTRQAVQMTGAAGQQGLAGNQLPQTLQNLPEVGLPSLPGEMISYLPGIDFFDGRKNSPLAFAILGLAV